MSSKFKYTAGLNHVGSYQVSAMPFASASIDCREPLKIEFPYVTRWIFVKNNSYVANDTLRVAFSENGVNGANYYTLHDTTNNVEDRASFMDPLELKVTHVWLSGSRDVEVVAGLTNIPVHRIDNVHVSPSGSNWSGSHGGIG